MALTFQGSLPARLRRAGSGYQLYCTVKIPGPVAVPPGVFSVTLPVTAPAPTVAVTCVSEFAVNVAFALPMVTLVVCLRLMPVIVTCVPTGPLLGLKLEIVGMILNFCGVVRLAPGSTL